MIFRSISEISLFKTTSTASLTNILKPNAVNAKACRPIFTINGTKQIDTSTNGRHCSTISDNEGENFDLQNVVTPISPIPRSLEEKVVVENSRNGKIANQLRRESNLSEQKAYQAEKLAFIADNCDGFYSRKIENQDFPPQTHLKVDESWEDDSKEAQESNQVNDKVAEKIKK